MNAPTPNLLKSALEYAARGWYVFPCREKQGQPYFSQKKNRVVLPKEKHPYIANGVNAASTNAAQIRDWWRQHPHAAIGCNCGLSGLFVFDLDMKDGRNGIAAFAAMKIDHAQALHSLTPSYGLHVIFSGSGKSSSNTTTGVDTRGQGGYIILPPSVIYKNNACGEYFQTDDWNRVPGLIAPEIIAQLFPKPEPKPAPAHPLTHSEQVQRVQKAVMALSPARAENYQDWVAVGMSLTELGNDGLSLWHEFSSRCPSKYIPSLLDEKWNTFRTGQGYTLGSLFFWANQDTPNYWRRL
jgi:hypothetical protein